MQRNIKIYKNTITGDGGEFITGDGGEEGTYEISKAYGGGGAYPEGGPLSGSDKAIGWAYLEGGPLNW